MLKFYQHNKVNPHANAQDRENERIQILNLSFIVFQNLHKFVAESWCRFVRTAFERIQILNLSFIVFQNLHKFVAESWCRFVRTAFIALFTISRFLG